MSGSYSTTQGDTWDLIAYKLYGNAFLIPPLLGENPDFIDMVIFPSGIVLSVPELSAKELGSGDDAPWRTP